MLFLMMSFDLLIIQQNNISRQKMQVWLLFCFRTSTNTVSYSLDHMPYYNNEFAFSVFFFYQTGFSSTWFKDFCFTCLKVGYVIPFHLFLRVHTASGLLTYFFLLCFFPQVDETSAFLSHIPHCPRLFHPPLACFLLLIISFLVTDKHTCTHIHSHTHKHPLNSIFNTQEKTWGF